MPKEGTKSKWWKACTAMRHQLTSMRRMTPLTTICASSLAHLISRFVHQRLYWITYKGWVDGRENNNCQEMTRNSWPLTTSMGDHIIFVFILTIQWYIKDGLYRIRLVRILCRRHLCSYVESGDCNDSWGSLSATAGGSPVASELSARRIALAVNCHGNRRTHNNCRGGVAEDSN